MGWQAVMELYLHILVQLPHKLFSRAPHLTQYMP